MGYNIALSGLTSTAEAIDVTSNNIANASTIGYKSGQYVFSDEFFRAQDPQSKDRSGMGAYRMAIRRDQNYGSLTNTQNPLDLALAGPGMFVLAKNVEGSTPTESPSVFNFTRNGQFGVDSQQRIVNENGQFLVGYPASGGVVNYAAKSVLILDQTPKPSTPTTQSQIGVNLDNSGTVISTAFNKDSPVTYTQSTSQTVFDNSGNQHTLSLYYQKTSADYLYIYPPASPPANGSGIYQYNAQQQLIPPLTGNLPDFTTAAGLTDAAGAQQTLANLGTNPPLVGTTSAIESTNTIATTASAGPGGANTDVVNLTVTSAVAVPANQTTTYQLNLSDGTSMMATKDATSGIYAVSVDRYKVYATLDGNVVNNPILSDPALIPTPTDITQLGTMAFLGGRNIDSIAKDVIGNTQYNTKYGFTASVGLSNENVVGLTIDSTLMSANSAAAQTYVNSQNGNTLSQCTGYSVDNGGNLVAAYDNGTTQIKGQVAIATFNNTEGLIPVGANAYQMSGTTGMQSGDSIYGVANSGGMGAIRSKTLESSNVDLTAELVKLMTLQRQYTAASQAVKVEAATIVDDAIRIGQ